jgi:hypothetical protein
MRACAAQRALIKANQRSRRWMGSKTSLRSKQKCHPSVSNGFSMACKPVKALKSDSLRPKFKNWHHFFGSLDVFLKVRRIFFGDLGVFLKVRRIFLGAWMFFKTAQRIFYNDVGLENAAAGLRHDRCIEGKKKASNKLAYLLSK